MNLFQRGVQVSGEQHREILRPTREAVRQDLQNTFGH